MMIKTTTTNTTIATITPTLEMFSSDEAESVGEFMKVLWTTAVVVASTAVASSSSGSNSTSNSMSIVAS